LGNVQFPHRGLLAFKAHGDGRAQSEFHHSGHRRLGNGYLPFSPFWKGPAGQIRKKEFLACIALKSLGIFERCRLWQQNYPATPDYSAAFFGEKEFEAVCFGSFILKLALKWAWSAYLRAF
jgi:hypothetical protein